MAAPPEQRGRRPEKPAPPPRAAAPPEPAPAETEPGTGGRGSEEPSLRAAAAADRGFPDSKYASPRAHLRPPPPPPGPRASGAEPGRVLDSPARLSPSTARKALASAAADRHRSWKHPTAVRARRTDACAAACARGTAARRLNWRRRRNPRKNRSRSSLLHRSRLGVEPEPASELPGAPAETERSGPGRPLSPRQSWSPHRNRPRRPWESRPEPPAGLRADVRETATRYPHRVSRRLRRKMHEAAPPWTRRPSTHERPEPAAPREVQEVAAPPPRSPPPRSATCCARGRKFWSRLPRSLWDKKAPASPPTSRSPAGTSSTCRPSITWASAARSPRMRNGTACAAFFRLIAPG